MIKVFCDKCGEEVLFGKQFVVDVFKHNCSNTKRRFETCSRCAEILGVNAVTNKGLPMDALLPSNNNWECQQANDRVR